jgi:Ca-activated chloride channel family protein
MTDFAFDDVRRLHLLWLLPVLAGLYAYGMYRKRSALRRFATDNLGSFLAPGFSAGRQIAKAALVVLATGLLIVALAGPRWGKREIEVVRRGVDIMVALDLSRSMLAEDCRPNRLEKAKQYIRDLVAELGGDRIGLVGFAGSATLACPLTPNYGWFRMALDEAEPSAMPRGGSNLADAIRLAGRKLGERPGNHKAILLITDGEDQGNDPEFAAKYAYEDFGVRVFALGLGDAATGRRVPLETEDGLEFAKNEEGQEHFSRLHVETLEAIAENGGNGFSVPAGTADVNIGDFYRQMLAQLDPQEHESQKKELGIERYTWFVLPALLLLVLEAAMAERRPAPAHLETRSWVPG